MLMVALPAPGAAAAAAEPFGPAPSAAPAEARGDDPAGDDPPGDDTAGDDPDVAAGGAAVFPNSACWRASSSVSSSFILSMAGFSSARGNTPETARRSCPLGKRPQCRSTMRTSSI